MKILVAYYSRSGHTETLAGRLGEEFQSRGHSVTVERIIPLRESGKWQLLPPLWPALPLLPLILWVPPFRRWWFRRYPQPELPIRAPACPDVSGYDRICIGGPKWLYIAYPLARYLGTVEGLAGKRVGAFATFCGPPLEVFEMEMLFAPIGHRLGDRGASLGPTLAISSHFHEFSHLRILESAFRLASRLRFRRSLKSFGLDTPWGREEIDRFCTALTGPAGSR